MGKPMILRNAVAQAKIQILRAMEDGTVPENVTCFGDLNDYIDANCLVGLCEDERRYDNLWLEDAPEGSDDSDAPLTTEGHAFIYDLQDAINAWLNTRTEDFPQEPRSWEEGEDVLNIDDLVTACEYLRRMYDEPRKRMAVRLDKAAAAQQRYVRKHGYYNAELEKLQERLEANIEDVTGAQDYDKLEEFLDDIRRHRDAMDNGDVVLASYFENFVRRDMRNLGVINDKAEDLLVIDWPATAARMRSDYSEVRYGETSYLVRYE